MSGTQQAEALYAEAASVQRFADNARCWGCERKRRHELESERRARRRVATWKLALIGALCILLGFALGALADPTVAPPSGVDAILSPTAQKALIGIGVTVYGWLMARGSAKPAERHSAEAASQLRPSGDPREPSAWDVMLRNLDEMAATRRTVAQLFDLRIEDGRRYERIEGEIRAMRDAAAKDAGRISTLEDTASRNRPHVDGA